MQLQSSLSKLAGIVFDFDGVFTDNRVLVLEDGREAVFCSRGDGMGIGLLQKAGIPLLVVSKERNPVVAARCKKLNLDYFQAIDDKLPLVQGWCDERGFGIEQIAYVGNDINDYVCLEACGIGVIVADAHDSVLDVADLKLTKNGGHGAVREFADMVLAAKEASS